MAQPFIPVLHNANAVDAQNHCQWNSSKPYTPNGTLLRC